MKKNNYPQGALDDMEPSAVSEIVGSLRELHNMGIGSLLELDERYAKFLEE